MSRRGTIFIYLHNIYIILHKLNFKGQFTSMEVLKVNEAKVSTSLVKEDTFLQGNFFYCFIYYIVNLILAFIFHI